MPYPRIIAVLGLSLCGIVASAQSADRLLSDGHYLRAEKLVRVALQRDPNDVHALVNLSVVDWSFNRFDAAIANAEKAVANAPNSVEAHSHLADALGAKLVSSDAGTIAKIALAHRFRKEVDRTLELDPNNVDSLQDLAQFYWHAPGMLGGDKTKARQTADKLFGISPFRGASARADFLTDETDANRRVAATAAVWHTAIAANANDYDSHSALAAALLEQTGDQKLLAEAESEANRARTLDGGRIGAYNSLAIVYARSGRWSELDTLLKQAKAAVPEDHAPGYRVAVAILNGNMSAQLQRAAELLQEYLSHPVEGEEPTHARAHWRLGQVLEKQGRKSDAVRELQTAVQMDGSLDGAKKDLKRLS